jgi:phage repressor protein C with HTH and peptisase S24 domain
MASIADRLRQIRATLDLNQREMAAKVGLSSTSWQRLELEDRPPNGDAQIELIKLGFSIDWLLTGRGSMRPDTPIAVSRRDAGNLPAHFTLLPRYNVRAGAGNAMLVPPEQVVDFVAFDTNWLRQGLGIDPSKAAIITAVGDSMYPTIADGDVLIVDLSIDRVLDNAIYALRYGDSLSVKRVQKRPTGGLRIISDNSKYEADDLDVDAVRDLHVVGRIVWDGGVM